MYILITFFFHFSKKKKDPSRSVKYKINLVWPHREVADGDHKSVLVLSELDQRDWLHSRSNVVMGSIAQAQNGGDLATRG